MLADTLNRFRTLRRNAGLYLLSNTLQAISAGAIGVLYALYLNALGYGTEFIGFVLVLGAIGGGLGIIPATPLVRRLGWRAMLIWSDLIGGVAITAQILVPTTPVIVITTLGVGASVAFVLVVNTPFLAANSTPRERTALFGLNNALGFLAAVTGSLLGGFLPAWFAQPAIAHSALLTTLHPLLLPGAKARTYELALLATGALALPSIIPVLLLRESELLTTPREATGHELPASPREKQERGLSLRHRLTLGAQRTQAIATGLIGRFSLTQALVGFGAGLFFPFANLYFVNHLGASTSFYGVVSAGVSICIAAASLLSAPLADRFGKLRASIVAQLSALPFLLALGLFPILAIATGAFLARAFLQNITSAPLQAYLMESVPEEARVTASSLYNVGFQVAGAAGSGVGGWLIALVGFRLPFILAIPFYFVSAVLLLVWFGRPKAQPKHV